MSEASLMNTTCGYDKLMRDLEEMIKWLENLKRDKVEKKKIIDKLDNLLNGEYEE